MKERVRQPRADKDFHFFAAERPPGEWVVCSAESPFQFDEQHSRNVFHPGSPCPHCGKVNK